MHLFEVILDNECILNFTLQAAVFVQLVTLALDFGSWPVAIYIRNQFIGMSFLCCCIQILDFLSFHHLFGPWAIIIINLLVDTGKFIAVLFLFELGFSMLVLSMNQPFYAKNALTGDPKQLQKIIENKNGGNIPTLMDAIERLFFALFGLHRAEDLRMNEALTADWTENLFKAVFAGYLLMAAIVLINLLIAMMSDTYQRIQVFFIAYFGKCLKKFENWLDGVYADAQLNFCLNSASRLYCIMCIFDFD